MGNMNGELKPTEHMLHIIPEDQKPTEHMLHVIPEYRTLYWGYSTHY